MNENEIEEEIQAKNLNAPRLTPDIIDSLVKEKALSLAELTYTVVC